MGYKSVLAEESAMAEFPGLSQQDLDEVDALFTGYLFFENIKSGRKVWTSCCHVNGREFPKLARTEGETERLIRIVAHNDRTVCPFCGRPVTVKNRKLVRSEETLREYHAVLFVHVSEDGETVWAQGYWTTKHFKGDPAGPPLYMVTRVYRFRRGEVMQWDRGYYDDKMYLHTGKRVQEPFNTGGIYARSESYKVIGFDRLEKSFLRYTWYEVPLSKYEDDLWRNCRKRKDLVCYLEAAAKYPRQVEMLRKAGCDSLVYDLVRAGKKNARVFNWAWEDPCKAFGLNKQELREFLAGSRDLDVLWRYKKLRKAGDGIGLAEAAELGAGMEDWQIDKVVKRCAKHRIPVQKLVRYLEGFTGPRCHGGGVTLRFVTGIWCDYIDAAEKLGYDLTNPVIRMPRDLDAKHDEAAQAVQFILDEEMKARAEKRYHALQKRYGYEHGEYFIRAPYTAEEIKKEGEALKHCVGGYAERHAKGTLAILFLRRRDRPGRSLATIEMQGTRLVQVHGWRNEREGCPDNPRNLPARTLYAGILKPWLAWVEAGSKRDKKGEPVMPKPKKAAGQKSGAA